MKAAADNEPMLNRRNDDDFREDDDSRIDPEQPITDAVLGTDPPMERTHPGLVPTLVGFSYPLAIILFCLLVGVYLFFTRKDDSKEIDPPATQSPPTSAETSGV